MSAKLLYSLTDDKKHMKNHNQKGCMNGLFHLFDRYHFLSRRVNHKRLPPSGDNQQHEKEDPPNKAKEYKSKNDTKDRLGISCESPRAPGSSSASSSNHTHCDSNGMPTPRAASGAPSILHSEYYQSPILNKGSDQLRDIVKERFNREVPGLLLKSKTDVDKGVRNLVKHIDSPRPLLPHTPVKSRCSGLDESFKKLRKFQEIHSEGKDRCLPMTRREGHRFSCDGRVTNSQDTLKSTLKLIEQPRLSLDSRACSATWRSENGNMSPKLEIQDTFKHTSIVAKLMGLDINTVSKITGTNSEFNKPSVGQNALEQIVASSSHIRNCDTAAMKPVLTSRLLVETAPWKDTSNVLNKPGFREAVKNVSNLMPSVYGEMEKRVTELEFKKSSSDLRALKQILRAMQKSKDNLEMKQELASDSMSQSSNKSIISSKKHQELTSAHVRNQQYNMSDECARVGFSGLRKLRTLDVARQSKDSTNKHIPCGGTDNSSIASPRTPRIKSPKLTQPLTAEKNNAAQSSGVVSPKLQQRQLRFGKKLQQTSLPSESTRTKGKPHDADSPVKRNQLRASGLEKQNAQLAVVRIKSSSSIQLDNSSRSDSNISRSSDLATEGLANSDEMEVGFYMRRGTKQENKSVRPDTRRSVVELNIIAPEQPSPVSVLDSMFYRDESPSPVKKISNAFINDESFNPKEQGWATKQGTSDTTASVASTDYETERLNHSEQLFEEHMNLYSAVLGYSTDMVQRKLVYDVVNEVAGCKLVMSNYNELSLMSSRVASRRHAKQKLLNDICSEINLLQVTQSSWNNDDEDNNECLKSILLDDMQKHGPSGSEFQSEISALVLDVERLIFKDLISEIVGDAAEGIKIKNYRHCRQLFCK